MTPAVRPLPFRPMTVAGVMSGTSADGIDVALTRIEAGRGSPKLSLLAHTSSPFPPALRRAVLGAMSAEALSAAALARLHWRLGIAYTEAIERALAHVSAPLDLVGCHGQTVYHQGLAESYAGKRFACTWQIGEPALIASALQVPVVSDFRPADMAAGGQGAPLVPLLDLVCFAHASRARVLQNIGGIGNLTLVPANARPGQLIAFDTGPGNMVMDAVAQQLFKKPFDRNGSIAGRGQPLHAVVDALLNRPYFRLPPPRSAGREQFGAQYVHELLQMCHGAAPEDILATATALTACSIGLAYRRFVAPAAGPSPVDYVLSGGGAKNQTLRRMLREQLPQVCTLTDSAALGMPVEAKEAAAFALLAYYTWHRRPANVPSATGAARPALLGRISYA